MDFDEGRDRRHVRTIAVAAAVAVVVGLVAIGLALALGRASVTTLGPAEADSQTSEGAETTESGPTGETEAESRRLTVGDVTFTDSQRLSDLPSDEVEGLAGAASAWIGAAGIDASDGVEVTSVTNDTVSLNAELSAGGRSTTVTFDGTTWRYQDDNGVAVDVPAAQRGVSLSDEDSLRSALGQQAASTLPDDFAAWADGEGVPHGAATLDTSKVSPTADGLGISAIIDAEDGTQVRGTFDLASSTWSFARG